MMDVPVMLKKLDANAKPEWGSMTASEMLDHLRKAVDISVQKISTEVVTPVEMLPKYKSFLLSDKPFRPGSPKPEMFNKVPDFNGDIEALKVNLMKSLVSMLVHFEKNPDHTANHDNFGELNTNEWMHLHLKHFQHHFKQFGLT
ncbi:MAG: DUF1569 domain-containing protein [Owenweeksia sp.]